jgi:hypothetical protein
MLTARSRRQCSDCPHKFLRKGAVQHMRIISVKLTDQELKLLTALASDQLFRREFIDPKMPGYKFNPGELSLGKKLVERLRTAGDPARRAQPRMSLIE